MLPDNVGGGFDTNKPHRALPFLREGTHLKVAMNGVTWIQLQVSRKDGFSSVVDAWPSGNAQQPICSDGPESQTYSVGSQIDPAVN